MKKRPNKYQRNAMMETVPEEKMKNEKLEVSLKQFSL